MGCPLSNLSDLLASLPTFDYCSIILKQDLELTNKRLENELMRLRMELQKVKGELELYKQRVVFSGRPPAQVLMHHLNSEGNSSPSPETFL